MVASPLSKFAFVRHCGWTKTPSKTGYEHRKLREVECHVPPLLQTSNCIMPPSSLTPVVVKQRRLLLLLYSQPALTTNKKRMFRITLILLLGFLPLANATYFGIRTPSHHRGRLAPHLSDVSSRLQQPLHIRGGSTRILDNSDDDDDDEEEKEEVEIDPEEEKRRLALQKWRMDQQMLMQLRSTFLSEALAKRGIPLVTITDVSTADGDKPPEKVDWDCSLSTNEEPKVSNMRFHVDTCCSMDNVKSNDIIFCFLISLPFYYSLVCIPLMPNPIPKSWLRWIPISGLPCRP